MTTTTKKSPPSFDEWTEGWPDDPRAREGARQARAPERKAKPSTLAEDAAEGVRKTKAAEAAALKRAKEAGAASRTEIERNAKRIADSINAQAKAAPRRPAPAPEPESANPAVRGLRATAKTGGLGRLSVPESSRQSTINEFERIGAFAREGRFGTAASAVVDRDGARLGMRLRTPGREEYIRADDFAVELDAPNGEAWLASRVEEVRSLPHVGELLDLLVVVAEQCIPEDLSGLQRIAAEHRAVIALLDSTAEPGWTPVDATPAQRRTA